MYSKIKLITKYVFFINEYLKKKSLLKCLFAFPFRISLK